MRKIITDLEKCTGCKTCELVCSFERETVFNPKKSAIRVVKEERIGLDGPVVCQLCRHPKCVEACPEGALSKNSKFGFIVVDEVKCTGCHLCGEACSFGAINFHPEKETPIICNLCEGKPSCVEWCHAGALVFSYSKPSESIQSKRFRTASAQFNHLLEKWGIQPLEQKEGQR
jgi:carbon-monoxide dehydrogenase iron sulfur subunit